MVRVMRGRVVLGSGVSVPGKSIKLTEGKYVTSATEVAATFREINGVPQYLAIPQ